MCSEEYRRRFAFLCKAILNSKWIGRQHLSFFFLSFFLFFFFFLLIKLLWFKWGSWFLVFVESVFYEVGAGGDHPPFFMLLGNKEIKENKDPQLS